MAWHDMLTFCLNPVIAATRSQELPEVDSVHLLDFKLHIQQEQSVEFEGQ